jgi:hypothetical protein
MRIRTPQHHAAVTAAHFRGTKQLSGKKPSVFDRFVSAEREYSVY